MAGARFRKIRYGKEQRVELVRTEVTSGDSDRLSDRYVTRRHSEPWPRPSAREPCGRKYSDKG